VERVEFRDLLLMMKPDLADKDIPHRSKLRESIITAWESWFRILKKDLSVCVSSEHYL
jgi:hypothetical protein